MEKIGEEIIIEVSDRRIVEQDGVSVETFMVWDMFRKHIGYRIGIFGPARMKGCRTLYMNALFPDDVNPAQERVFPSRQAAISAWQASAARPMTEDDGFRHGVRKPQRETINEQGFYRARPT